MRRPLKSWRSKPSALVAVVSSLIGAIDAVTFQRAPASNLDLSDLGRVALTGNFDGISLYDYIGQGQSGLSPNGSQSIYGRYPSGAFAGLVSSDAHITTMCPFIAADGTLNGIVVGGNFTSIGQQEAHAVALFNPDTLAITPLPGLSGQVNTLFCDNDAGMVYVGGSVQGGNSTNAIAWTTGWTNLPFAGFNGPVSAIAKLGNGNVVFGGSFTAIGNLTATETRENVTMSPQVVNVGSAEISVQGASLDSKFNDAASIICTTPDQISPNTSFLLQERAPGSISAKFQFGFIPSVIRLLNTQVAGWGTKTFSFTAFPINGILNLTYHDANGTLRSCSNACPLAQNASYQEFSFVNMVGMNSFRLDLIDWYDQGAGLGGIELFQDSIVAYAVDNFNSPRCDGVSNTLASSTMTGPWKVAPSGDSYSQYLSASLPQGVGESTDVSVVFMPNIQESGNYSINMWTPGCLADNSCATRGQVNITGTVGTATSSAPEPFTYTLYQNQNNMKFDQIYYGYIEAPSGDYRPSITLTPSLNQKGPLTIVAQRIELNLTSASAQGQSTNGLNGLFEYNPNNLTLMSDFTSSIVDIAGTSLSEEAKISALVVVGDTLYAGGSFGGSRFSNVFFVTNGNASDMGNGGLNGAVDALYTADDVIYIGGSFTGSNDSQITNLGGIVSYSSGQWRPVGAGVNGQVLKIAPLTVNISGSAQDAIAFSGSFDQINGFGDNPAIPASNLAVWVLSRNNWLQNLNEQSISLQGTINAYTTVPDQDPLYSGSIRSQGLGARYVVGLSSSDNTLGLQQLPLNFASERSLSKRQEASASAQGIRTALFYQENGLNLTILGGGFTSTAANGSQISNLAIVNGTSNDAVSGVSLATDSTVFALDTHQTTLFVGGSFEDGILFYDLVAAQPASAQPPALSGNDNTVRAIALQPDTTNLFVGGSFSNAGSLGCPGLCIYDIEAQQWNPPSDLSGNNTINVLQWGSDSRLILAGNMSIGSETVALAYYDAGNTQWTTVPSSSELPGPITAFTTMDDSWTAAFVAGPSGSSSYLAYFDGDANFTTVPGLGDGSIINGLQVMTIRRSHAETDYFENSQILLISGQLNLDGFGSASAATFNGTAFSPLILSTLADGSPGTMYGAFVQNPNNLLDNNEHHLALGFVVLIGLACALGVVFLLVVLGIIVERIRRHREGYVPAPTGAVMYEKDGGHIGGIAPERLFSGVGGVPESGGLRI